MTEKSYYWDGTTTGDATLAPHSEFTFHGIWRKLFLRDRTVQGIIESYANECAVVGVSGGVTIDTGAALVDGMFYENDKKLTIAIPIPSASTRIDVIVLRRDATNQTIRATRIQGVEGGSAPSIIQINESTWDIKIAEASITTAGVITVTDYRNFARSPIFLQVSSIEAIETIITDGGEQTITFDEIPDTYRHLFVTCVGSMDGETAPRATPSVQGMIVYFNNDTSVANYNIQYVGMSRLSGGAAAASAGAFAGAEQMVGCSFPEAGPDYYQGNGIFWIPNYKDDDFYKTCITRYSSSNPNTGAGDLELNNIVLTFLWENTAAINRIDLKTIVGYTSYVNPGSKFILYGIK